MAERRVVIENRKTGEQYAVTPAAFRKHYEDNGFRILHWEGGEEYLEQPTKAASTENGTRKARKPLTEAQRLRRAERRAQKRATAAAQPVGPLPQPEE